MRLHMPAANGRFLLVSLIAALFAGLLFTPGLPGEFVFDDIPNIVNNESIKLTRLDPASLLAVVATPQVSGSMRGLPTLTFALDYWRAGSADPATFKTTNIVLHVLTTCALAWFFRSLLLLAGVTRQKAHWLAPALALAWAAHPLQVSSVLYAVQRLQTMGTFFLVLALCAYVRARQAQIEGRPGRTGLLVTSLLWALAMGCKEDSVLLPVYTLALELTVLRFAAANPTLAGRLRKGYLFATLGGAAFFLLWAIPHYWVSTTPLFRDFNSAERLLTQGRVLCMYLGQVLLPLPQHMPFHYDWVQPSRSLLQPWTTLPAIMVVCGLLGIAWWLRKRMPLFALGVFLFFGAHFIASNVILLELAYEHRNHFALIGAVLAVGSLLAHAGRRLRAPPALQAFTCVVLLLALGSATLMRAYSWRSAVSLAQASTESAPNSGRAWVTLCAAYLKDGGGPVSNNPQLDNAIAACGKGATAVPEFLNNAMLLIVLKSLRGDATPADWADLQKRVNAAPLSFDNRRAPTILMYFAGQGVKLNKRGMLQILAAQVRRVPMKPSDLARFGYFVLNDLSEPDLATPYFIRAIEAAPPTSSLSQQIGVELRTKDRPDLAAKIEQLGLARSNSASASGR